MTDDAIVFLMLFCSVYDDDSKIYWFILVEISSVNATQTPEGLSKFKL